MNQILESKVMVEGLVFDVGALVDGDSSLRELFHLAAIDKLRVYVPVPEVSAAVAYVISLMCAPKPEDRPRTSGAAADLLVRADSDSLLTFE